MSRAIPRGNSHRLKEAINSPIRLCFLFILAITLLACERNELVILPLPNGTLATTITSTQVALVNVTPTLTATLAATYTLSVSTTPTGQGEDQPESVLSPDEEQILRILLSHQVIHEAMRQIVTAVQRGEMSNNHIFFMLGGALAPLLDNDPLLEKTYLPPLDVHAAAARVQQTFLLDMTQRWLDQQPEVDAMLTDLSSIDPGATLKAYEEYLQDSGYLLDVISEAIMRIGFDIFGMPTSPWY